MRGNRSSPAAVAGDPRASLLHSLVDQSPALIAIRGTAGDYLYVNQAFAQALGVPAESLLGRHEDDVLCDPASTQALRIGSATAASGVTHGEEEFVFELSARRFLTTRFPIRSHGGRIIATGMIATEQGTQSRPDAPIDPTGYAEARHAELLRALEQMERLAYTDRLTGAWNRRHLEDAALLEMSRAERHGHPVALLVIDIDHFKAINDHFGHAVGDYVLVELVRCIRSNIRRNDTVTRWGGEEFIVLAPDTPLHEAERLAQKLCDHVAAAQLSSARQVTISIGVAEYQSGEGLDHWLSRADRAMYRAKAAGRNRVVADPYSAFGADGTRRTNSPVQLVWRDSYNSGDTAIDRQHRELFEHANRLLQAVITHVPREQVLDTARLLIDDIVEHFADEERLHGEIGFPGRAAHAAEHARLLDKATRLFDRSSQSDELPVADIFHFLAYEVVAQHLVGADRHYFPYLEKLPDTTAC
jgi:diguanylate cyclase (GGDEF)-like protein/hemerythrin-like metal-binding protein